ncbi:hypothetical protein EV182_007041 [Spiromyces aspiralis]|uniref:Uncharacterized protein n=1 Tax=Spiromyces aspiralis TaxID=68401 RepID=A0ACC1HNV2_9FUNG|nr:hypothetical protein EV182_007041 [Spiromyces aspiralis]
MGSVATSINTPTAASPFDTLTSQNSSTINYEMGGQNPFAASRGPGSMASAAVSPGVSGPDTLTGMFGNAFDGGSAAKPLPFSINPNDPNSKLADIARNSARIDPFANLASGGSGTVHNTANPSNGFGSLADLTSSMFPATSNIGGSRSQQAFGSVNRNPFFDSGLAGGGSSNGMSSPFGSSPKPTLNQLQQSFSAGGGQPGYTTANPFGNSAANSGGTGGSLI